MSPRYIREILSQLLYFFPFRTEIEKTGEGEEDHLQGYGHAQGRAQVLDRETAREGHAQEAVMGVANMMTEGGDHHSLKGYCYIHGL